MTKQTPIQDVRDMLDSFGIRTEFREASKDIPFDIAIGSLGFDLYQKPVILQIQQINQKIALSLAVEDRKDFPLNMDFLLLAFIVTVPIEIPDERALEVLKLLSFINKSLPVGSFNYSEIEKSVYYSYSLTFFDQSITEKALSIILSVVTFAKESFFPLIHEVSVGRETVESLLEETLSFGA